jgi:hypothetical protein
MYVPQAHAYISPKLAQLFEYQSRYMLQYLTLNIGGTKKAMAKLFSQLLEAPIEVELVAGLIHLGLCLTYRCSLRTDRKREDFGDESPRHRAPGCTESSDVNPDQSDGGPACGCVRWPVMAELGDNNANSDHAGTHHD